MMRAYTVGERDTLERIAAAHDVTTSEVVRANKLHSRIVFTGQTLRIPPVNQPVDDAATTTTQGGLPIVGPGLPVREQHVTPTAGAGDKENMPHRVGSLELDADCLQRFIKLKVKQITCEDGAVSGTLLVTPNCMMFDPDVNHPLVKEKGADPYGMVAPMEQITSAALYEDLAVMEGAGVAPEGVTKVGSGGGDATPIISSVNVDMTDADLDDLPLKPTSHTLNRRHTSQQDISPDDTNKCVRFDEEEDVAQSTDDVFGGDLLVKPLAAHAQSGKSCPTLGAEEEKKEGGGGGLIGRSSLKRLGNFRRSLSVVPQYRRASDAVTELNDDLRVRASTIGGSIQSGAKAVAQGTSQVVQGTTKAAGAVVDGVTSTSKAAVGHIGTAAKHTLSTAANISSNIVDELRDPEGLTLEENWFSAGTEIPKEDARSIRWQQSQAALHELRTNTHSARQRAMSARKADHRFQSAVDTEGKPDLFKSVDQLLSPARRPSLEGLNVELPFYLAITLNRNRHRRHPTRTRHPSAGGSDVRFGNKGRHQFWYTVPRDMADTLFQFLMLWQPIAAKESEEAAKRDDEVHKEEHTFLVIEGAVENRQLLSHDDYGTTPLSSSQLNRQWEIVTVEEVRRRLSLSDLSGSQPLPKGCLESKLLSEAMLQQMIEVLPARAAGYPWLPIYTSDHHGFSLKTLYRRMYEWVEDMSPVILVVRDTHGRRFGACTTTPIRQSEYFYGRGDSSFLFAYRPVPDDPQARRLEEGEEAPLDLTVYTYTGENENFVVAQMDGLAIGSSGGHYGLWLDADLNHGRTQACRTFDNDPLTDAEDFIVEAVEAWGFSLDDEPWLN